MLSRQPDAPTRRRAVVPAVLVALAGLVGAPAHAQPTGLGVGGGPCTRVDLAGDIMDCTAAECHLTGHVTLRCETMALWADELEVKLADGRFAGGTASGNVVLVDGNRVTTCKHVLIEGDRIHAAMSDAQVRVKRGPPVTPGSPPPTRVPTGRDQAVYGGTRIERLSNDRLRIEDASFTLCDCDGGPPSWELRAGSLEATLGERATVYWPVFWVHPFGMQARVPITPPLPVLSLPLTARAPGFLPPRLAFYSGWPTVDLPFFVPLGESWDVTVAPGLRSDFADQHGLAPDEWGGPRLGLRLRYAPSAGTRGEWDLDWTHDPRAAAAVDERLRLVVQHRSDLTADLRLVLRAGWLSDDQYPHDFRVQVPGYLPSRGQLQLRTTVVEARLSTDYLVRMGNPDGNSNLSSAELEAPQHGPALRLTLVPLELAPGLSIEGDASVDRYGAWGSAPAGVAPSLVLARAAPSLALARPLGPVSLTARAGVDGGVVTGEGPASGTLRTAAATAEARASITFARQFDGWLHRVSPQLVYRGIPWRSGPALATVSYSDPSALVAPVGWTGAIPAPLPIAAVDEHLRRDTTVHQAMLSIAQEAWSSGSARVAALEVGQPYDLRSGTLLPTRLSVSAGTAALGAAEVETAIYLPGLSGSHPRSADGLDRHRVVRELSATVSSPRRWPLTLSLAYNRYAPEASRFLRSIDELEAPLDRFVPGASWVHYVAGIVSLELPPALTLRYLSSYYLPYEGRPASDPNTGFPRHIVEALYHSPCDCWDLHVRADKFRTTGWSVSMLVSVAGYGFGSTPAR